MPLRQVFSSSFICILSSIWRHKSSPTHYLFADGPKCLSILYLGKPAEKNAKIGTPYASPQPIDTKSYYFEEPLKKILKKFGAMINIV